MKKVKGQPITGSSAFYSSKKPFVPDAKETSANEETFIKEAPMPFKNSTSTGQSPPAGRASGGVSTMGPKILSGLKRTTPGAKALPPGGPVGQRKAINQSRQIGGRMGFPPPKRKAGDNGSGYPSKRNARFFGEN